MQNNIEQLAKLIRYYSLISTTAAGSGHPTSSLSAADLTAVLMFGGFLKTDLDNHEDPNNDRLIFSKGHASPLFYALYAAAGKVSEEELKTLRKFGSKLEGHPTLEFPYTEVPTGSLGQGLSVGVGMALNARLDKLSYKTFVLLGDSEMAEGSVWEAMASASHYQLHNLIAILDCNRLGQRGETMYGHHTEIYKARAESFGWEAIVVDGHNIREIQKAMEWATSNESNKYQDPSTKQILNNKFQISNKPRIIIAKTLKGKGVSFIEDKEGKHGVALKPEELEKALEELGSIDKTVGVVAKPAPTTPQPAAGPLLKKEGIYAEPLPLKEGEYRPQGGEGVGVKIKFTDYTKDKPVSTRKAYGNILPNILESFTNAVVLDAEVSNSTFAETVKKTHPEKFFEMYIAEQNMVGAALGFSRRGKIPFISTFAAFFSRAFDQIRMSQYAKSNIKFVGSHAGVSIGEDGSSQMGLEEIAMFRTLLDSVVLYPSDAVSTEKLTYEAAKHKGNVYIQTTRKDTPIIYSSHPPHPSSPSRGEEKEGVDHNFKIGGSCILKSSENDVATVVAAGITVHEALAAYEELQKENINIRVIDLYSIKPLDVATLKKAAAETKHIITMEDHFVEGGIGEAVAAVLSAQCSVHSLAVKKMPKSGKPEELLAYEEIDKGAIIKKVKEING